MILYYKSCIKNKLYMLVLLKIIGPVGIEPTLET